MKCYQTKMDCRRENEIYLAAFIKTHHREYSLGFMTSLVSRLLCEVNEDFRQDILLELKEKT